MKLQLRSSIVSRIAILSVCAISAPAFAQPVSADRPNYVGPGEGHLWTCAAQNVAGEQFMGQSYTQAEAEDMALNSCNVHGGFCAIEWCY